MLHKQHSHFLKHFFQKPSNALTGSLKWWLDDWQKLKANCCLDPVYDTLLSLLSVLSSPRIERIQRNRLNTERVTKNNSNHLTLLGMSVETVCFIATDIKPLSLSCSEWNSSVKKQFPAFFTLPLGNSYSHLSFPSLSKAINRENSASNLPRHLEDYIHHNCLILQKLKQALKHRL